MTAALVAVGVFWIAFDGGSYAVGSRNAVAIVVWWGLFLAIALSLWPLSRLPLGAAVTGGFLAAFAALTVLSLAWAESAEDAFDDFNRVGLYLGVYLLAALAATRANARGWAAGVAVALVAVGLVALASRLFADAFPENELPRFLAGTTTRLSYPLGYWNGLAAILAFAFPLLLWGAAGARSFAVRGLALAPVPALVVVVYMTSSRGGSASAVAGTAAFVVLTSRRWAAAGALVVAGLGSAAALAVVLRHPHVVDGPFDTAAAAAQGRTVGAAVALACVLTGAVYALAARFAPSPPRMSRLASRALLAVLALVLAAAAVAARPVERFEAFKQTPAGLGQASVREHLLSGSGNGRWQLWTSAADAFGREPLLGLGAGAYEAWWAQHGSIPLFVRNAHSLYLEVLAELGVVGLLLLAGFIASALLAALSRLAAGDDEDRTLIAAAIGVFVAFLLEAAVDWIWELSAVTVVAMIAAGLLTGRATGRRAGDGRVAASPRAPRIVGATAGAVVALAVIASQAIPLLAHIGVRESQEAARRGDAPEALDAALAARDVQPWAATPHLQLALVEEQFGDLSRAHAWIEAAIERDPSDWRLWLVKTRIETSAGRIADARGSLARARELNPRSPIFAGS